MVGSTILQLDVDLSALQRKGKRTAGLEGWTWWNILPFSLSSAVCGTYISYTTGIAEDFQITSLPASYPQQRSGLMNLNSKKRHGVCQLLEAACRIALSIQVLPNGSEPYNTSGITLVNPKSKRRGSATRVTPRIPRHIGAMTSSTSSATSQPSVPNVSEICSPFPIV